MSLLLQFGSRLDEIENFLTHNRIWNQRLRGVGVINFSSFSDWSLSGVMARSAGLKYDLRVNSPYELYEEIKFSSFTSENGDSYDRYLLRLEEMRQSADIIVDTLILFVAGELNLVTKKFLFPQKKISRALWKA